MKSVVRMSVLALSLAAAGAAQAQSSVTLYGSLDMGVGYVSEAGKSGLVANSGQMTTSFFGLKGSEDLGNGYKTVFNLTSFFRVDNGRSGRSDNEAFFSKEALLGLQAPWGMIAAGKVTTPLAASMWATSSFGGSSAFGPMFRQLYAGTATVLGSFPGGVCSTAPCANRPGAGGGNDIIYDTTWNNSFRYTSPNFNGLTFSVQGAPGEVAGKGGRFNVAANALYASGPLTATVAFQRASYGITNESAQPDGGSLYGFANGVNTAINAMGTQTTFLTGASYDFKFAKLFGQYAYVYNDITSLPTERSQSDQLFTLGATVPFGVGYFTGAWGRDYKQGLQVGAQTLLAKGHRDTVAFAYNYPLSKRTDIYAAYRFEQWDNIGLNLTTNLITTGLRTQF